MLSKPQLIVVTGRPGVGKTTFAKALSKVVHLPLISRDEIKEGFLSTLGVSHGELPPEINAIASGKFFALVRSYLSADISIIVEAAFQHPIWEEFLQSLKDDARISILLCKTDEETAKMRYLSRGLAEPHREYFHGDSGVDAFRKGEEAQLPSYRAPDLPYLTISVDTTGEYTPSLQKIAEKLFVSCKNREDS